MLRRGWERSASVVYWCLLMSDVCWFFLFKSVKWVNICSKVICGRFCGIIAAGFEQVFADSLHKKGSFLLRKLRIWSHLLKKSLTGNFVFCAVTWMMPLFFFLRMFKNLPSRFCCWIDRVFSCYYSLTMWMSTIEVKFPSNKL